MLTRLEIAVGADVADSGVSFVKAQTGGSIEPTTTT